MQNNYIVRTKENKLICFYYDEKFKIYCKIYENNKWSKPVVIVSNAREFYTINISESGELYLFCQNIKGDITLCRNNGLKWTQNIILENKSNKIQNILFNAIITNKGLSILYNIPISDEKAHFLTTQSLNNNGKWLESTKIDKIISLPNTIFQTQAINSNHLIIFYQKRTSEINLGYREFTPNKIGGFNSFHTTSYQIIDHSFLTTNDSIHFLYIVKGLFSSQVYYRKKESHMFENPIILTEGQKLGNCCLLIVHNKIYASWTCGAQLYQCISDDYGQSFSRPTKYKRKFCLNPKKAVYLSYQPMNEKDFIFRELYIDSTNPSDVQLIPDLYEEFYPVYIPKEEVIVQNVKSEPEFDEEIQKLKNQIFINKSQLEQKDKQIMHLTTLLQKKNEEMLNYENNLRAKYKKITDENNYLKSVSTKVESVNNSESFDIQDNLNSKLKHNNKNTDVNNINTDINNASDIDTNGEDVNNTNIDCTDINTVNTSHNDNDNIK